MKHAAATFLAAVLTFAANAAPVRQATETWVTNKIDAIVGTNTAAKIASATNATLTAANAYTDAAIQGAGQMTPEVATNIAGRVTSNVVTKAYVGNLGFIEKPGGMLTPNGQIAVFTYDRNLSGGIAASKIAEKGKTPYQTYITDISQYSLGDMIIFNGTDTADFKKNYIYKVVRDYISPGVWSANYWQRVDVQPHQSLNGYVPTSRKVNGQPLTSDIDIEGMTDNALVLTNNAVKTKNGTAVTPSNIGAKPFFNVGSGLTETPADSLYAWRWYYYNQSFDEYYTKSATPSAGSRLYNADGSYHGQEWFVVTAYNSANNTISIQDYASTIIAQRWASDDIPANPVISVVDGFGMPGHGLVLTNGSVKTKAGGNVTAANIGAATPAEVSTAIENAGHMTQAAANAAYYPKAQGDAWSTYWDGDDVRVTVTNYDSAVRTPWLYLEQRTNQTAQATNLFRTVWNEKTHWQQFLGSDWDWEGTWAGFKTWAANVAAQIADKADRAWGFYDSHTGTIAPDGFTSVSSSNVLICAGATYQKRVTSSAEVWVLTADEPYTATGAPATGGFQLKDGDGNVQFEIIKGDKVTVKAQASAVTVDGATLVVTYNVIAGTHPTGEVCLDLASQTWKAETAADCPATVSWSGTSGAYVARITPKQATTKCFFKATYQRGGDTYINNRCAVGMSQIVLNGTTYNLGTNAISGKLVLTLTPAN